VAALASLNTDRIISVIAKHTKLEPDFIKTACRPAFRPDGMVNLEGIIEFQKWGMKNGGLDRVLEPPEFWDPSFVRRAAE
jgi:hypothetical protein